MRLPPYEPPAVPREWRAATLAWEGGQLRSCVDPTCTFWLTREKAYDFLSMNIHKYSHRPDCTHERGHRFAAPRYEHEFYPALGLRDVLFLKNVSNNLSTNDT
ncbi:hypothetical protein EVAR_80889_1 [Eumeta japonica]|uniref:Uncharacterized protein n=1 Tax=Eumeta variegata TaxID=151549 RepID=A0A4C1V047_EUMVA|nr:hypothetical protein EVAR_80889_1 [Eumeta japonica]